MIKVVPDDEAEKADFVVCMRVPDLQPIDPAAPLANFEQTVRAVDSRALRRLQRRSPGRQQEPENPAAHLLSVRIDADRSRRN